MNRGEKETLLPLVSDNLIQPCQCNRCITGNGYVFNLKNTNFYMFLVSTNSVEWMEIDCRCEDPCLCDHGSNISFEEILDQVPYEVQTKILYHIDVFA